MNPRVLAALLTLLGFAAGYGARLWTEGQRSLPPPPARIGGEFGPPRPAAADPKAPAPSPIDRKKLVAEIEKLRPQIDAFRKQMEAIDAEFERELVTLLTPEQLARFAAVVKKRAERAAKGQAEAADPKPLSDEDITGLQRRSLYNVLVMVAPAIKFGWVNHDLKLDEAQKSQVRDLLNVRREQFLALVDTTPPPSITLSQLAPVAQKLAQPKP